MSKQKLTYNELLAELEKILAELENNPEIDMEQISEKIKRSTELLNTCKKRLHEIDTELDKMLQMLD